MVKRIGFIGYDKITALDLIGPLEAFDAANSCMGLGRPTYETVILSAGKKPFRSEAGLVMNADSGFGEAPPFDTIVVPGGAGLRDARIAEPIIAFLKQRVRMTRRVVSICTGLYALAEAGFMDGRRVTTHWHFADRIAEKFPKLIVDADALFIRDGKFLTSAGVTAGIDLSLALIAEDMGEKAALAVARELVVYLKRPGGQAQFSEPLQFQTRAGDGFSDLAAWMLRNLGKDLSVEVLAARVHLGARHFSRRFKAGFGLTPAAYVERLRLDEARKRLSSRGQSASRVGASLGYASADAFRRAFERRFGVTPKAYEKQFRRGNL